MTDFALTWVHAAGAFPTLRRQRKNPTFRTDDAI